MIARLAFLVLMLWSGLAQAFDYGLKATPIAPDTYVVIGTTEHFNRKNGGNIVNTGFIVTAAGVVVIDSGPSLQYGRQLKALIAGITSAPVTLVVNTHAHPDHYLGNGAFEGVSIAALAATRQAIVEAPPALLDGIYRLVGDAMAGTQSAPPTETIEPGARDIGGHRLRFLAFDGHTAADLALLDETTGVLFAGDLAFLDRTPTTPHADIGHWLAAIEALRALDVRLVVPGHGPPAPPPRAFDQTAQYLQWLARTLTEAAGDGLDAAEVMALALPPAFAGLAVAREEFARSVAHLYRGYEVAVLGRQ